MLPKVISLDWDGKLADTRPAVVASLEDTLTKYDKEPWDITKKKYRDTNKSLKENFPNFFGEASEAAYDYYLNTYLTNHLTKIEKYPEYDDILSYLNSVGIAIGVISNKEQLLLEQEIDHLYPMVNFAFVFGNGAANKNKPDPAPLTIAAEQLSVPISEQSYWHIGDSKQDTDAAIASGAKPILIGSGKFFKEGKSDRIVNIYSPSDLLRLIQATT